MWKRNQFDTNQNERTNKERYTPSCRKNKNNNKYNVAVFVRVGVWVKERKKRKANHMQRNVPAIYVNRTHLIRHIVTLNLSATAIARPPSLPKALSFRLTVNKTNNDTHTHTHIYIFVYIYIYTYTYTHTYTYIHIYIHMCT